MELYSWIPLLPTPGSKEQKVRHVDLHFDRLYKPGTSEYCLSVIFRLTRLGTWCVQNVFSLQPWLSLQVSNEQPQIYIVLVLMNSIDHYVFLDILFLLFHWTTNFLTTWKNDTFRKYKSSHTASIVCSPIYNIHSSNLENVQRRFLKAMVSPMLLLLKNSLIKFYWAIFISTVYWNDE